MTLPMTPPPDKDLDSLPATSLDSKPIDTQSIREEMLKEEESLRFFINRNNSTSAPQRPPKL